MRRALRLAMGPLTVLMGVQSAYAQPEPTHPATASALDAQRQARAMDRDIDRARAAQVQRDLEKLRSQLIALGQQAAAQERTVGGARGQLRKLNLQEAELKQRIGRNQEALTKLLGALQMFQRNPPPPLLVDPRSARDAARAAILIQAIAPELEARSKAFTQSAEQLKAVRRRTAAASGDLFQAESDLAERQAKIAGLIEQKRTLEQQLRNDAKTADEDVRRLAAKARSLGELVTAIDAQSRSTDSATGAPNHFTAPLAGPVSRLFGQAGADPLRAKGWTWTTEPNAPVLSPAVAHVDYAGPLKDWGLVLILKSGELHLVIAGLAGLDVDTGQTVAAGEPIGRAGPGPERPEVYLEVRRGGAPVDPAHWFSSAPAGPLSSSPPAASVGGR